MFRGKCDQSFGSQMMSRSKLSLSQRVNEIESPKCDCIALAIGELILRGSLKLLSCSDLSNSNFENLSERGF